jgi:hypothetical protein
VLKTTNKGRHGGRGERSLLKWEMKKAMWRKRSEERGVVEMGGEVEWDGRGDHHHYQH